MGKGEYWLGSCPLPTSMDKYGLSHTHSSLANKVRIHRT